MNPFSDEQKQKKNPSPSDLAPLRHLRRRSSLSLEASAYLPSPSPATPATSPSPSPDKIRAKTPQTPPTYRVKDSTPTQAPGNEPVPELVVTIITGPLGEGRWNIIAGNYCLTQIIDLLSQTPPIFSNEKK